MSTIRANSITNSAGTGAPDFPNGVSVGGSAVTATAAELNVLDGITAIASQAEAEAGTSSTTLMTPLRVTQAIDALANPADYESAQQVISTAAAFTLTHGLGKLPSNVQAWFVCVTASEGWSVGDWYGPIGAETFADGANNGIAILMNTTQIKIKMGAQATPILSSAGARGITYANWRLVVRAWK